MVKLILVDLSEDLCDAWRETFDGLPDVEIVHGAFDTLPAFDCIVSPANAFGLMDGGIDAALTQFFGEQLMQRVQQRILAEYFGEQPVGTSMIVATEHEKHPLLAHTPTMRVPTDISNTDNVYQAMSALLRAVYRHNQTAARNITTVACSGLGTGYGRVPVKQAARQMALAYHNFLNPPTEIDWIYAQKRHNDVVRTFYD